MEVKQKKCKCCNSLFTPYKSTDRYCSYNCANKDQKHTKQSEKRSIATKKRTKIRINSTKREAEMSLYSKLRKIFLSKEENKYCPVASRVFGKRILATETHHKAGRVGQLLNYQPMWLAVSREGHRWIHDNPAKSYELGFLVHSSTVKL